jgi:hypothetical protein
VLFPGQGPHDRIAWVEYLQPYLKNRQVLFCPSASTGEPIRRLFLGQNYERVAWLSDYGLAWWGPGGDGSQKDPYWRWPGTVLGSAPLPGGGCTGGISPCSTAPACVDLMTLARLVRPAETIAYSDGYVAALAPVYPQAVIVARHHKAESSIFAPAPELDNRSGVVVGFIDGHSKFLRSGDIDTAVNDNGFWRMRYHSADR